MQVPSKRKTVFQWVMRLTVLLLLFFVVSNLLTAIKIYPLSDQAIVTQYASKNFMLTSFLQKDEDFSSLSCRPLFGSTLFQIVDVEKETTTMLTVKKRLGKARLIAYDEAHAQLIGLPLQDGDNTLTLPKGSYRLYLVGQGFWGKLRLSHNGLTILPDKNT